MKTKDIEKLEEKYFKELVNIFHSNDNKCCQNLLDIEQFIRTEYTNLTKVWAVKNKLKIAVERLIRFHIFQPNNNLNIVNIYPSPLSPDEGVELHDAILCIDAKATDMVGNANDEQSLAIQKNQITFHNVPKSKKGSWPGLPFPPQLAEYHAINNKPVLTFFINFCYEDDPTINFFKLSHISICCVPHSKIVERDFNNDLAHGFKTWAYIEDDRFGKKYEPVKESTHAFLTKNWTVNTRNTTGNKITSYLEKIKNPLRPSDDCLWKKPKEGSKEWKIALFGLSARIDKSKLNYRTDSNGDKWGVAEFKIPSSHQSGFLRNGKHWYKSTKGKHISGNVKKTLAKHSQIQNLPELGKP